MRSKRVSEIYFRETGIQNGPCMGAFERSKGEAQKWSRWGPQWPRLVPTYAVFGSVSAIGQFRGRQWHLSMAFSKSNLMQISFLSASRLTFFNFCLMWCRGIRGAYAGIRKGYTASYLQSIRDPGETIVFIDLAKKIHRWKKYTRRVYEGFLRKVFFNIK